MSWAWERGEKLLMLPDQHLGGTPPTRWASRSTRWSSGIRTKCGAVSSRTQLQKREADSVEGTLLGAHALHRRADRGVQEAVPDGRVIAHPECTFDVVQAADESGSTEYIINTVRKSPPGTTWAVATEVHLVNRLTNEVRRDKTVVTLDPFGCLCSTMFRVSPNHLLWVLEGLVEGKIHNQNHRSRRDQKNWPGSRSIEC